MTTLLLASCGGEDVSSADARSSTARSRAQAQAASTPADAAVRGTFGALQNWPLIPLHVLLTPDGRVMSYGTKADGTQTGNFIYDVWDSADGSHLTLANGTGTDLFCSSQLLLPGGDAAVISGGDNWTGTATNNWGNSNSNVYSVVDRSLKRGADMNRARWYASSLTLLNGETFIMGGSGGQDHPEIRSSAGAYRLMNGIDTWSLMYNYPRNFIAPDGRVFGFDGNGVMYWITTAGDGTYTGAGQFDVSVAGKDSTAAMYAPGRILQFGGNSSNAVVIDINGGTPVVANTTSLSYQRRLGTATLLPNGQVLASGGSSVYNATAATDPTSVVAYQLETWNPVTGVWTLGATGVRSRLYHSVGLLLPDATVLVAGGGAPGPEINTNGEIYSPPYLYTSAGALAARPVITLAPTVVDVGRSVAVGVASSRPIARVTFVATGAVTHGTNMNQRFYDLPFTVQTAAGASATSTTFAVQIPSRASDVPPGTWMMFALDDQGVPSVAKMVRVNVAGALDSTVMPVLQTPANQKSTVGSAVTLRLSVSDPNGDTLRFSASGLPSGLAIDATTGAISGTPTAVGTYAVDLAVSDGTNSASATLTWTVASGTPLVLSAPAVPAPSVVGTTVSFTAAATGAGVAYTWNFGDGTTTTSAGGTVGHVYKAPGIYAVTVTARAVGGESQTQALSYQAYLPATAGAPTRSSSVIYETVSNPTGRAWVVNPDSDSVMAIDTSGSRAEIAVGSGPRTVALAVDGTVWVTNKVAATISVINPATMTVTRTIALPRGSQPHGIAMAGSAALVALEATGNLLKIDVATGNVLASLAVGPNPRHVAVTGDGATAYVSRYITPPMAGEATATVQTAAGGGEVVVASVANMTTVRTIVLAHGNKPDAENQGRGVPNYLGAMAISPDGSQAYVPSKQDNIARGGLRDGNALNFQNTVRAISSRIDLTTQAEDTGSRIDHDNSSVASAAAFDPLGLYLFVALETSREVAVIDAFRRNEVLRFDVGRAPQGLVVSPDRRTLYVQNFMDRTLTAFDITPLTQQSRAAVTPLVTVATTTGDKLGATVLAGKQLFYDARDTRLARDRYMSCASCHNDGGHDGRVWDMTSQGEGLRNTIALAGRAGTGHGLMHWSGNFDEVQDFEGQIRTLAGGTGLMSNAQYDAGTRGQPLGDRKGGLSADLDALAAYVGSLHTVAPSPYRNADATLTATALAGKAVFAVQGCASCHGGPAFTGSADGAPLKNVGTLKPSSGKRLSGALTGIDTPTLRDVWATAPYLHDGSAPTLAAAVQAHSNVSLSAADLASVAEYLRQIGSDEPAPGAADVPTNLALGKVATQSSTVLWAGASRAVDGNTSGNWSDNSVTHTDNASPQPWWQVDLGAMSSITTIRLWNRTDCCADRLSNAVVFVAATDMTGRALADLGVDPAVQQWRVASLGSASSLALPVAAKGRYVRVQLTGQDYLSLAEVQVFGTALPALVDLAQGKVATQSSTAFGGDASHAVDGNTSGDWSANSVTHTDNTAPQPWWQVDLGTSAAIDSVRLWNRTDCCGDRLSNFDVFVAATDMTGRTLAQLVADPAVAKVSVPSLGGAPSLALPMGGASGRYVRIQLTGQDYLSLAEVQIYGTLDLAQGKAATQSSSVLWADASRAVDGNTSGDWSANSVTHTDNTAPQPWWQVDLGAPTAIDAVKLWNRTDCCADRLSNFEVFVSGSDMRGRTLAQLIADPTVTQVVVPSLNGAPNITLAMSVAAGRYVRIQLKGQDYLSLAEVQVFGH